MASQSPIEWTEATWNPVTGCTKISPGCKHCYAERMARRLQAMGVARYKDGFSVALHDDVLEQPRKWKKPRLIFVNSMSDLFHDTVPEHFIQAVFKVMVSTPQHTYQVLTKRAERLAEMAPRLPWPENVWQGVSIESPRYLRRLDELRRVKAAVRFLSIEPLLAPFPKFSLRGVDWVIVGGESGPNHRHIDPSWVRAIRDQCLTSNTAFFFKQWGGRTAKSGGRTLDGKTWFAMPKGGHRIHGKSLSLAYGKSKKHNMGTGASHKSQAHHLAALS
jgi:protein gp37